MNKVVITGGGGVLGTKIIAACLQRGVDALWSINFGPCTNAYLGDFGYADLDITDHPAMLAFFCGKQIDTIIHAAAFTDVDGAEAKAGECRRINVDGTAVVAECARQTGAKLVYISTDYVFDGRNGPYHEDDAVHPLGIYGQTKLEGEKVAQVICPNVLICRTMALYGFAPHITRYNYVGWLLSNLCQAKPIRVLSDQYANHTVAEDLSAVILALVEKGASGVFNTAGFDRLTRFDFARKVASYFGIDQNLIHAVASADMGFKAERPLNGGLVMDKLASLGIATMSTKQQLEVIANTFPFSSFGRDRAGGPDRMAFTVRTSK